jgi:hypothetical protein
MDARLLTARPADISCMRRPARHGARRHVALPGPSPGRVAFLGAAYGAEREAEGPQLPLVHREGLQASVRRASLRMPRGHEAGRGHARARARRGRRRRPVLFHLRDFKNA